MYNMHIVVHVSHCVCTCVHVGYIRILIYIYNIISMHIYCVCEVTCIRVYVHNTVNANLESKLEGETFTSIWYQYM